MLLKYGHAHLYRGRNPFNAYTIGNFTHEFSISNGMEAIGITVVAYGPGYVDLVAKAPDSLKPLTKNAPKQGWNLIDLRPLRALCTRPKNHRHGTGKGSRGLPTANLWFRVLSADVREQGRRT